MIKTVTLSLLFLKQDDQILLAMKKRGFGEGKWNGVGGKIENNETIEQAMIRETSEEIGVRPTIFEKVADIRFDEYFKGVPTLMHVHVYIATVWKNEPTESEEMAPRWFNVSDIPYDSMWPDDPYWLPLVLEGKKISADFKLDQSNAILSHTVVQVNNFEDEA